MSPLLRVSEFVAQRLKNVEEGSFGFLLGILDGDLTYVLGISRQLNNTIEENEDAVNWSSYNIVQNLPAGITCCGIFTIVADEKIDNSFINEFCKIIETTPVVIAFNLTTKELTSYIYEDDILSKTEHTIINKIDLLNSFLHLRLTAVIPLSCDFQNESAQESFTFIQEKINDGNLAFHILESGIYILGDKSIDISGISPDITLDKLFSTLKKNENNKNENIIKILDVGLYLKGTNNDNSPQLAPLIKYSKKVYKHARIHLFLDSLAIAPVHLKLKHLYPILVESACRNLALNKQSLSSQLNSSELRDASIPETHHFFPSSCGHFVSIVYPAKQTCEQLKNYREAFHSLLCLPMDKPLFRRGNVFDFSQPNEKSSNLILNPHEGLRGSMVPDGDPCIVHGTYAYHHYMQDKFDDSGWGCAYRSLQTIFSWFRFQGYTNMPVPSHREIQQCLVNIGDKPASFVGSKQWIGSTEVSFVLDTLLGVTSRIVNVSSGEEMSMSGGELSYHFKTQGTPVMIGGGVLAHTILGVDYNKKTGAIKFLILDPHYTGDEDLKVIHSKGWCGWKGPEFWKKDAFYNMCLPLRPKCV